MYKGLLKNRNFVLLALGGFISTIGDYLYNIAITVALYSVTNSIGSVALMWLSRGALRIPIQYLSGIIADKYNRKIMIVVTNFLSVLIAFLFIYVDSNRVWLAYILAFLLQSLDDIDVNCEIAILPELVKKEELSYANASFSFISTVCIFLSPALSGIIYKVWGSDILFQINAISFLIAGSLFAFIMYDRRQCNESNSKHSMHKGSIEILGIMSKNIGIRTVFIIMSVGAILGRFYETYKVAIADILLNINAEGIIYFDYALAIGGLLVPVCVKVLSKYNERMMLIISSILINIGFLIFGYSTYFLVSFTVLIVLGILFSIQGMYSRTIIQKNIPQEYLGRAFSFYKILLTAFAIIGLLIANPLYKMIGIGNSFLIFVVVSCFLCIISLPSKEKSLNEKTTNL